MDKLIVIASSQNWMDTRSVETLEKITRFEGVTKVVGLPDLSIGKYHEQLKALRLAYCIYRKV